MYSNYPPGVTGAEFQIAGPDYEKESTVLCSKCRGHTTELGFRGERWLVCQREGCNETMDLEPSRFDEPDPDRAYDEARDRKMFGDE